MPEVLYLTLWNIFARGQNLTNNSPAKSKYVVSSLGYHKRVSSKAYELYIYAFGVIHPDGTFHRAPCMKGLKKGVTS